MCGIIGYWTPSGRVSSVLVQSMASQILHRGPDDSGIWLDEAAGLALAHCRLAVVDLSPAGHQPMVSTCGRYVLIFNGEIYNHLELRRELELAGAQSIWRGSSDTETLLSALRYWGVQEALKRMVGMFAFALWDRQHRRLTLARDRLGEKPLYYGWQGGTFLFASELKAFHPHPDFRREIDCSILALYFQHGYIPAPYSVYRGIYKLIPGTFLHLHQSDVGLCPDPIYYWSFEEIIETAIRSPFTGGETEAVAILEQKLLRSVREQMLADVPLGAFLSGGIDSSMIVALMQAQSSRPVKTFTIGFHEKHYNEAAYARSVADHLKTEHSEFYVTPTEVMALIPRLPTIYDEPFADVSQIPTFLVAQLARRSVTVALSGDGGDELFGGYERYIRVKRIFKLISQTPSTVRSIAQRLIGVISATKHKNLLSLQLFARLIKARLSERRLRMLRDHLQSRSVQSLYLDAISLWQPSDRIVVCEDDRIPTIKRKQQEELFSFLGDDFLWMMAVDMINYLPDDILVKVDRAAMAVSLETRAPFLDHRVVEFSWRIPVAMKIRHGRGKWLMRQLLYRYVPKSIVDRPKMGFGVPLDVWLREPLREWAEDLLDTSRLNQEPYLNVPLIRRKWQEHLKSEHNWQYLLWPVLMFQAWLASCKERPSIVDQVPALDYHDVD